MYIDQQVIVFHIGMKIITELKNNTLNYIIDGHYHVTSSYTVISTDVFILCFIFIAPIFAQYNSVIRVFLVHEL